MAMLSPQKLMADHPPVSEKLVGQIGHSARAMKEGRSLRFRLTSSRHVTSFKVIYEIFMGEPKGKQARLVASEFVLLGCCR